MKNSYDNCVKMYSLEMIPRKNQEDTILIWYDLSKKGILCLQQALDKKTYNTFLPYDSEMPIGVIFNFILPYFDLDIISYKNVIGHFL